MSLGGEGWPDLGWYEVALYVVLVLATALWWTLLERWLREWVVMPILLWLQ
jgi:hypothetical protein